jgi:hypothetical protein
MSSPGFGITALVYWLIMVLGKWMGYQYEILFCTPTITLY